MTKTILRLTLSGALVVLTGIMILAAKFLTPVVFSFYPDFSRGAIQVIAAITSIVPIALCELLLVFLLFWFVFTLVRAIKRARMVRWLTGVLLSLCILVTVFVGLWGLNYYAPPMQERLNIESRQYSAQELKEATIYYRDMANSLAPQVKRDADGVMAEYDFDTLAKEYFRDKNKGLDVKLPRHYFPDDNPEKEPIVNWRSAGQLLWTNWINYYVYQTTPYDIRNIN